jgi:3D (Asp-Asp-Asp) domain-containing protein
MATCPTEALKALKAGNALAFQPMGFTATAYSPRGRTTDGRIAKHNIIAAAHQVFSSGTRVRLKAGAYSGEYVVAETGGTMPGRDIDIWLPTTADTMRFDRRPTKITILSNRP